MGIAIDREEFTAEDAQRFAAQLERGLAALRELLARPGFGAGPLSVGAELEVSLVDAGALPLPVSPRVLGESMDPRLTWELDRFNLECNLRPGLLAGRPFAHLEGEMYDALGEARRAAALHSARVAVIGILPTLRAEDLQSAAMTDTPRFRALSRALQERRRKPFRFDIDGDDPLETSCDDVTFEGANTSLQIHLKLAPADFASVYNATQMATVVAVAACGNSPTFLGHRLWRETRVALFKQAVDDRQEAAKRGGRQARVSFGSGWVRDGALELFEEAVHQHEPLLPMSTQEDPLAVLRAGDVPRLEEIRLHQGTVWRWNRPVYDPDGDAGVGHLRIELRALPAGPSVIDMAANAAFLVGLSLGLAPQAEAYAEGWSFEDLHRCFYRAARDGLAAEVSWPEQPGGVPRAVKAADLVRRLLPVADLGLARGGVEPDERRRLLDVIDDRAGSGQTGAEWQRRVLDRLGHRPGDHSTLARMLECYLELSAHGTPVHEWPIEV